MGENQDVLTSAIQMFLKEDQTISFWDHPNFKSHVVLPDKCYSITRAEQGLELIHQGRLDDDTLTVMKVIGDAYCVNENQLRRYLSLNQFSFSRTSKLLSYLRKYRLIERYKCRLAFIEEEDEEAIVKPPAPFALGIGGYKLLKYLYPSSPFMEASYWYEQPLNVQRYVAMNEIRCLAAEAGVLRQWDWNPPIGGSTKYKRPMAVAKLETPQGDIQFLMERTQMAQNFKAYLRKKLEFYRYLYEKDGCFRVDGFSKTVMQVVCIYTSSVSMARYIQEDIGLHRFPFDVWLLVDEWISKEKGMSEAFCIVKNQEIQRIRLPFFSQSFHVDNPKSQ